MVGWVQLGEFRRCDVGDSSVKARLRPLVVVVLAAAAGDGGAFFAMRNGCT